MEDEEPLSERLVQFATHHWGNHALKMMLFGLTCPPQSGCTPDQVRLPAVLPATNAGSFGPFIPCNTNIVSPVNLEFCLDGRSRRSVRHQVRAELPTEKREVHVPVHLMMTSQSPCTQQNACCCRPPCTLVPQMPTVSGIRAHTILCFIVILLVCVPQA